MKASSSCRARAWGSSCRPRPSRSCRWCRASAAARVRRSPTRPGRWPSRSASRCSARSWPGPTGPDLAPGLRALPAGSRAAATQSIAATDCCRGQARSRWRCARLAGRALVRARDARHHRVLGGHRGQRCCAHRDVDAGPARAIPAGRSRPPRQRRLAGRRADGGLGGYMTQPYRCRRTRRAAEAAQRARRPRDHRCRARPVRRVRRRGAVHREGRRPGRSRQGDDLPALAGQGRSAAGRPCVAAGAAARAQGRVGQGRPGRVARRDADRVG